MIPSIFTAMFYEAPLDKALREMRREGWTTFEIATEHMSRIETDSDPKARIDEVLATVEEMNLSLPQAHGFLTADVAHPDPERRESDIQRLERHLRIAAELDVRNVVIHPGGSACGKEQEKRNKVIELNTAAFRRLGDLAGELSLRIALENLAHPGATTADEMMDLIEAIDRPTLGIALDTSHANMCGLDIPDFIKRVAQKLIATHISDNDGSSDQHRIPGNGVIDWPAVMCAFRSIEYKGILNLEIGGERHPLSGIHRMKTRFAREVLEWLILSSVDNME